MDTDGGLICAYLLDGKGSGTPLDWAGVRSWKPTDGLLWVHLDHTGERADVWLRDESGLDPVVSETLLQDEVRPRLLPLDEALLVILRGVNLNPGADPEDMVGIRVWIDGERIITLRHRRIMAVNDIREEIMHGRGPKDLGDFLVSIARRLIDRMGPVIALLDDRVDDLEDKILEAKGENLRPALAEVRREAIQLRRYLAPQREVIAQLSAQPLAWLSDRQRAQLREIADRTIRYLEDLDAARERAAVTQEELNSRLADQMNKTMYVLTVVAAILLPPSLITGLFGINVGGMPGTESNIGFVTVVLAIILMAVFQFLIFRRLKWI